MTELVLLILLLAVLSCAIFTVVASFASGVGAAPAILLAAVFNSSTSAVISWQQPPGVHQTCLRRVYGAMWPAGICMHDLPEGTQVVELPGELTHPAYRPAHGDVYILSFEGIDVGQATLGEAEIHRLYMPLAMQSAAQPERRVYLAWVGR